MQAFPPTWSIENAAALPPGYEGVRAKYRSVDSQDTGPGPVECSTAHADETSSHNSRMSAVSGLSLSSRRGRPLPLRR